MVCWSKLWVTCDGRRVWKIRRVPFGPGHCFHLQTGLHIGSFHFIFMFKFLFYIGAYVVVLPSGVQKGDSLIHIHISMCIGS